MNIDLVLGYPASGKTSYVKKFLDQGYTRLNRDELGGTVDDLLILLVNALKNNENVVLDNLNLLDSYKDRLNETADNILTSSIII